MEKNLIMAGLKVTELEERLEMLAATETEESCCKACCGTVSITLSPTVNVTP